MVWLSLKSPIEDNDFALKGERDCKHVEERGMKGPMEPYYECYLFRFILLILHYTTRWQVVVAK